MSARPTIRRNAAAMKTYVLRMLAAHGIARQKAWRDALVPTIERRREKIRIEEGGGGMCHVVTELLEMRYGWMRLPVTYLDPQGEVICAGHLISLLPDGSLLDPTADQFGEGYSVRRVTPRSAAFGRYRPEFDPEFNPTLFPEETSAFAWNGKPDYTSQDEMTAKRGHGWWLKDTRAFVRYLERQVELGGECYRDTLDAVRARRKALAR